MRPSTLFVLVFTLVVTAGPARGEIETINFAELPAGTIASEVFGSGGSGPVRIFGLNPRLGTTTNAALIFDSSNPTGKDEDLGSPNETFEIDGQPGPGRGVAGVRGAEFENSAPQGKLLIIAENLVDADGDGLVDDPDDMAHRANLFTFDFSEVGSVTVDRMTLIDVERSEGRPVAKLFGADGQELQAVGLPATGDNGLTIVDFGSISGVSKMTVSLGGSGAISSFRFEADPAPVVLTQLPQTASRLPSVFVAAVLLICLGGALRLARR